MSSTVKFRRSAHREYMRKRISAQSFDSVPPAPAWMEKMALLRSNCPVRNDAISSSSSSATRAASVPLSSLSYAVHELHHDRDIVDFLLKRDDREHGLLQGVQLRDVFLGFLVAGPKIGRAHLRVHGLYFTLLLVAVKETSIDAPSAS
jgi:hypothetical protein